LFWGVGVGIGETLFDEFFCPSPVYFAAFGLNVWAVCPTNARTFIPGKPEPFERVKYEVSCALNKPGLVGIFYTKYKGPTLLSC
jgi:hypothetical protein